MTLDGCSSALTPLDILRAKIVSNTWHRAALQVIPLELLPAGEFDLIYRSPLDPRSGELPVLPLSITGAVAMAHAQDNEATSDGYVAADQFFIMKFDKQQAGLSGLAFDEGRFGVFGYITKGMELLPQLQSGDIIVSAKILSGADRLVQP